MFDRSPLFTGNDVNVLIQSFNRECTSILDQVAPIKTSSALQKKTCPWINESILNLRRICRKIERLWKKTKLDVHRLHLRDLMLSLNDTVRTVRSEYFSRLIRKNKRNPKFLFDKVSAIVSPDVVPLDVHSKVDSNKLLRFFVDKINDINAKISPKLSCSPSQALPLYSWLTFTTVTYDEIATLLQNLRPISKLPFMSKLLEKAVAVHLTPYLEKYNIHDRFQSGFRKLHSTETALLKVTNDIMMSANSGEYTVLVLLDLTSAFDTVNHTILINRLRDLVGMSGSVLDWFSSYISERSFSVSANQIMSESTELLCGVPQGSVLGPILFLIYILPLSQIIQQFPEVSYHLFADDIQLYYLFKPTEAHKLSNLIDCLTNIKQWLNNNCLQLNPAKTETLIIAPGSAIPDIKRRLGDLGSSQKHNLRKLGVIFDEAFSLEGHLNQTVRTCFFHLGNISKLRSIVSTSELEMIIHAFISTRLDYCNSLFTCLNMKGLARLQVVQNSAARLLTRSNKGAHMTPVLKSLHWLPIRFRFHFKILVLTFRALQRQAPPYIADLIHTHTSTRNLRSANQNLLVVPRGDRSFQAVAPRLWNALPLFLRGLDSVETFKKQLKTFLFQKAFN
ncbi:uncharacterized protein LOC120742540 [Simochromis diagramma]|uniref:uncharacterized protein LOC120742540 n=1 Tax=Simochromis diagramma TaxID=43689 RepID=UPI001A7ED68A|nr:uncharacterized protein LOC120742540 [Simochromis diagramma]